MVETTDKSAPGVSSESGKKKEKESWGEFFRTVIYALLIALVIRTFAYEPFNIPSESMLPNLLVGDYLFVSKYPYGYSRYSMPFGPPLFEGRILEDPVERGDIVVFKLPLDGRTDYIKRVIGLPGDRIQVIGGVLYINGEAVEREPVEDFVVAVSENTDCVKYPRYRDRLADGTPVCRYPQFRETLPNGKSYMTLDLIEESANDMTGVYVVPRGHYFVMGDNRDASLDSRVSPIERGVGYVPAANIVGRAEIIFFSTDGEARLWTPWNWFQAARFDRFFDSLRN